MRSKIKVIHHITVNGGSLCTFDHVMMSYLRRTWCQLFGYS